MSAAVMPGISWVMIKHVKVGASNAKGAWFFSLSYCPSFDHLNNLSGLHNPFNYNIRTFNRVYSIT